ncbi:PREDICTED: UHRF1-binding protein 1-like, partial [Priapulus caudatus]|uniref:UHRF1-binding protein 1-like n=1 Tax=Priapulus caudatus TaxID=37621 RepID=A0ABM1F619_PRICU
CSVVTSRLQLILDDLLWVLTDTQLKAALHFVNSLKSVIAKSNEQSKVRASKHLQVQIQNTCGQKVEARSDIQKLFAKYDIVETSYHVYCGRIDLHLCEDANPDTNVKLHSHEVKGGAMQVTLHRLIFDLYPFHIASGERKHWVKYNEGTTCHHKWVKQLLDKFREQVAQTAPGKQPPLRLMSSVTILRLDDFVVGNVTYHGQPPDPYRRKPKFCMSDKKRLYLPPDLPVLHAEWNDYYFPAETNFP